MILRIIRPDQLIYGLQNLVNEFLGPRYTEFKPADILSSLEESTTLKPIIFILAKGSDPRKDFELIADQLNMSSRIILKSMGQG